MHPWTPPPAPPKPPSRHTNYRDLVSGSYETWGQDMTEETRKHPDREQLKLGALFEIINLLHELIREVKRPR